MLHYTKYLAFGFVFDAELTRELAEGGENSLSRSKGKARQ